jgi:hypothetical protein
MIYQYIYEFTIFNILTYIILSCIKSVIDKILIQVIFQYYLDSAFIKDFYLLLCLFLYRNSLFEISIAFS